jgi:hypothetical protein
VNAKVNPVNFGAADYVRCRIIVGTSQKDAGATLLGNAAPGPTGEMGPSVAQIALQDCGHNDVVESLQGRLPARLPDPGIYVDPGAKITILSVL